MTHAARIRRPLLALAALAVAAAIATPALAGNRGASGCDDSSARAKGGSSLEGGTPAASAPARRDNASIEPGEGYVPLSRNAPPAASPAPRPADTSPVPVPVLAPRADRPAAKAKATSRAEAPPAAARRAKPGPATSGPAKMSLPNLPATPGMGTLLRVGISAGREIS